MQGYEPLNLAPLKNPQPHAMTSEGFSEPSGNLNLFYIKLSIIFRTLSMSALVQGLLLSV
jgi:hypothetical protein